jgi:hypothetical protein
MVWAHDSVASDVEALAPFIAFVLVLAVLFLAPMFLQIRGRDLDGWAQKIIIPFIGLGILPGGLIGAWLFLNLVINCYADRCPARQAASSALCVRIGIRQSMPSSSIDNCAGVSDTLPEVACGHTKRPRSRRLAKSSRPWPSNHSLRAATRARP